MSDPEHWDALVIGAGAGGLFTAARLAHRGYRTLVVERLDKVGGRASTDDIDGFKVNNGAIVIETGGITEQTCHEVGAAFDVREPKPPLLYRIGGKDVDVTGGGWGFLLSKLTRQGAKLLSGLGAARSDSGLPRASCPPRTGCGSSPATTPCRASSATCAARCSRSVRRNFRLGCS